MRCKGCNHTNPVHAVRKMEVNRRHNEVYWTLTCEKCGAEADFVLPRSPTDLRLDVTLATTPPKD